MGNIREIVKNMSSIMLGSDNGLRDTICYCNSPCNTRVKCNWCSLCGEAVILAQEILEEERYKATCS